MARKKGYPTKSSSSGNDGQLPEREQCNGQGWNRYQSPIIWDMMSIILEGALDQEMDEELGYSKYDYRNKATDNSRNGHSQRSRAYELRRYGD